MDFSKYAGLSHFTLKQAATLFCETDIVTAENRACVQAWFDELVSAAKSGELPIEATRRQISSSWMGHPDRYQVIWDRSRRKFRNFTMVCPVQEQPRPWIKFGEILVD
ncbi:MAG: hypothetical protein HQM01_07475 [Magnetococcales bacterium]|nr:hypothetical protein [Magnetococcales bacterium]